MILDLHNHSVASDDARAKVQNYCQWIARRELPLDGFVLSEHRQFDSDSDYRDLEDRFGLVIMKASEVETEYGHVLLFGVNEDLRAAFDFSSVKLSLRTVLREAERCGAIAVPCHPGRPRVGMSAHFETLGPVDGVTIIETLNGGSRGEENERAIEFAKRQGFQGVGGSDAHIVSHIGRCVTEFDREITSIESLVENLKGEDYRARSMVGP